MRSVVGRTGQTTLRGSAAWSASLPCVVARWRRTIAIEMRNRRRHRDGYTCPTDTLASAHPSSGEVARTICDQIRFAIASSELVCYAKPASRHRRKRAVAHACTHAIQSNLTQLSPDTSGWETTCGRGWRRHPAHGRHPSDSTLAGKAARPAMASPDGRLPTPRGRCRKCPTTSSGVSPKSTGHVLVT